MIQTVLLLLLFLMHGIAYYYFYFFTFRQASNCYFFLVSVCLFKQSFPYFYLVFLIRLGIWKKLPKLERVVKNKRNSTINN